jgi:hypothetical protein
MARGARHRKVEMRKTGKVGRRVKRNASKENKYGKDRVQRESGGRSEKKKTGEKR